MTLAPEEHQGDEHARHAGHGARRTRAGSTRRAASTAASCDVLTCNEQNTPCGAADCARRAVKEDVVAVVGSYSQHGRSFMSPLEARGHPLHRRIRRHRRGVHQLRSPTPSTAASPRCWPATAGSSRGACAHVSLVRPDTIAGDGLPRAAQRRPRGRAARGQAADMRAAEDATEYSRQARQATGAAPTSDGTDRGGTKAAACVTAALGDRTETFFDSFRRLADGLPGRCGSPPCWAASPVPGGPHGGGSSPLRGRVRHRLVPARRATRAGTRCAR